MAAVHRSFVSTEQDVRSATRLPKTKTAVVFCLATALTFLLYLRTMAPTVYGLDSAELTAGAYVLGIVHSPGSPTYLLLGHLFTWLPFGDVGYRVNLLSSASAAIAIGFVAVILCRLTRKPTLALAGALYLGTTYYVWVTALAAELYALHSAFIALLIWLGLLWRDERRPRVLLLLSLIFGVGLGNHLTLGVLAPGFVALVAGGGSGLRQRPGLVVAAGCVAAGWSVYLYLPLRAADGVAMNYARDFGVDVTTWNGFWWMVSGGMFDQQLLGVPRGRWPAELGTYAYRLWSNFVGLGAFVGLIGVTTDLRRQPWIHGSLLVMFLGHLAFILTYDVVDKDLMLVPTFLVWGLWCAIGADRLASFVNQRSGTLLVVSGATLLALMSVGNVVFNFARVDISGDWSARARGEFLMRWLPPHTLYLSTWADAAIVDYFQLVEGRRPDVDLVNIFLVRGGRRQQRLDEHLAAGKPVYASGLMRHRRGLAFEFVRSCNCYRVFRSTHRACAAASRAQFRCEPAPETPAGAAAPP